MRGPAALKREGKSDAQQKSERQLRKSERSEFGAAERLVERTAGHDRDAAGEDAEVRDLLSHGWVRCAT